MRLVASLLRSVLASVALTTGIGACVALAALPLSDVESRTFAAGVAIALLAQCAALAGVVTVLVKPLARALDGSAGDAAAGGAGAVAQRLPSRIGAAALSTGGVATAATAVLLARTGPPVALVGASAALGLASAVLAATLAYFVAAAACASAEEALEWHGEGPAPGTVRGKIVVLALGLGASCVLLLAPAAYLGPRDGPRVEQLAPAVGALLATALLAWAAARAIALPFRALGRAADRIASGDLTASPPSVSQDEMGRLAADFRRMAHGLKVLVADVQAASEGVSRGAHEAGAAGARVRAGALSQHAVVTAVQQAVEATEGSAAHVSRGAGALSEYVTATSRAAGERAVAHEEVGRRGTDLERATASALHGVEHLGAAGRAAEATLGQLEALAGHSGATLAAVRASVAGLERAAADGEATAASAAEMAFGAGGVAEETVHGIEALRAAVSDAHRRIGVLGRRSDDIDRVVDFISEVAGRTNLLSLNASIIAAQAGEHGKAFSVVADQIRELASQIARSTTSIGDIIHAVREDVEATAALIDRGDALAVEGVQLARNSLEVLSHIQRSTAHGRDSAAAMRAAVEAHGQSAREVSQLVQAVGEGGRSVAQAVQLVGRSVGGVRAVARAVGAMAEQLGRAIEEQGAIGAREAESLGRLERMVSDVARAAEGHEAATRRVRDALRSLSASAGSHEAAVEGLAGASDQLNARAKALADRVGRFKV
jgi:methyl-accepting chemotaxis protein